MHTSYNNSDYLFGKKLGGGLEDHEKMLYPSGHLSATIEILLQISGQKEGIQKESCTFAINYKNIQKRFILPEA